MIVYQPRKANILANALSRSKRMELDVVNNATIEGDKKRGFSDDSKFNCGHRGSQHLEDSAGGRPSSPRYNSANEVAASKECIHSKPSRVIGVGG